MTFQQASWETLPATRHKADAVRITPLDTNGQPAHPWGFTHHFTKPIHFSTATRIRIPAFGGHCGLIPGPAATDALVLITAPDDHPDAAGLSHLITALRERGPRYLTVETWGHIPDLPEGDRWLYELYPRYRDEWDQGLWENPLPPEATVCALGRATPADGHTWPDPPPTLDPSEISRGALRYMTLAELPPPRPGYGPGIIATPAPHLQTVSRTRAQEDGPLMDQA